jgi:phosphonate metabolism-associated iron-containing alcohol dehydrogenase
VVYRYHNPVDTYFGAGIIGQLPNILAGRKAFVVTFPEARALGLIARLERILGSDLVGVDEHIDPNPDVSALAAKYQRFWKEHAKADVVLAVGGGSAIDTAKALVVGTKNGTFAELLEALSAGGAFQPHAVKALIAVPTTAGTGSEVTPWATIWDKASSKKYSLHLPQTWPEAAIIDPELMLSLPDSVTIQSGLDALSHALESIWNRNANPVSDIFAVSAAREVIHVLPQLLKEPGSIALRGLMAQAALKAGMAFSNTKTALAHSISYEMTLRFGVPHGIACSFTLPMVLERAIGCDQSRDQVLAKVFDCSLSHAPEKLRNFLEALGVHTDFYSYGVSLEESQAIVIKALDGIRGKNFIGVNAS